MLFVFGYRANQLRSKKLSVLIHNSAKYPNVNQCKVAVHFQQIIDKDDGTFEFLPNTEIVIGRTAFKNNTSYYFIDKREVKFKEVAKVLESYNIDLLHNRFLILQGEVESIALMKPKALTPQECGLLEYLEDIIGTERYKKPLSLITERLEKLNDERTEKHNRCRLAEREMKDLEQPMSEAVNYLKKENKWFQLKNLFYQIHIHKKKNEIVKTEEDKVVAVEALKVHDDKFEEVKKSRLEKEKTIAEEMKKHEELVAKFEECKSLAAKAKDAHQRVDAKLKVTNSRRKDLHKQVAADEKKLVDLQNLPEKNKREIEESQVQIDKLTKEKEGLDATLAENLKTLAKDTQPLQEKKEPLDREVGELRSSLDKLKAVYSEAEKELEIIKKDETTEARKFESLKNSFDDNKRELEEKKIALNEIKESIPKMDQELNVKQQQLKDCQREEGELNQELRKYRMKLDEGRSNMQMAQSSNRVLNALMKEKQKGNIPGILGRLGDLGGIDAKYDVAISTCCGRLDNIVVENVETATKCIEFLKNHNVGRATFISLDKIGHLMSRCKSRQTYPQNAPRLFDLIKVEDERVLTAFYFSLYDTLVANNMQQAREIAYGAQRYRVVTLTGEVIETSGTMAGGGKTQMRGRMGQKVTTKTVNSRQSMSDRDLDALSINIQNLQTRINDLQHQQGVLENEIKVLMVEKRKKEQEYNRHEVLIKSLSEQIPRLQDQLAKQKQKADSTKSDQQRTRALEEKVKKSKDEFEKQEADVKKIQQKVDAINQQIKDISDKKVKEVKSKIDKISKQIEKFTVNINKLTVEINNIQRNIQKTEEKIENAKTDITEAENSIKAMVEERTGFAKDSEDLEARIEELQTEISSATTDSSEVKKEITKLQKEEADGKIKRIELDEKVKTLEEQLKEKSGKIPAWEKQIKALKLHEIPNEEMPDPPFKVYPEEELAKRDPVDTQYEITRLDEELATNKPNLGAIDEYNSKRDAYLERVKVLDDVTVKRNEMREALEGVKKKRFTEFTEGFQIISRKLKEMYQMITLGGDAELELVDSMDPFTEGIVFSVRPPKKSWKVITNLSGGEKTLSSLALVFALHYYKPSPLYFMDEIDAALDFKNVSIVANYINVSNFFFGQTLLSNFLFYFCRKERKMRNS